MFSKFVKNFIFFSRILDESNRDKYIQGKVIYYDKVLGIFGLNMLLIILIIVAILMNVAIINNKPSTEFYAINLQEKTTNILHTDSKPMLSPSIVEKWVEKVVVQAMSFDFSNYNNVVQESKINFTDTGFVKFTNGLKASGYLDNIYTLKLQSIVTPITTPIIIASGMDLNQDRYWTIQGLFLVSYSGAIKPFSKKVTVILTVTEVPTYDNPYSIAIEDIKIY